MQRRPFSIFFVLGFCTLMACAGLFATLVHADDDHEYARRAYQAKEVLSLTEILDKLKSQYPGQVLDVELEREKGLLIYEIKLLRQDGALFKLEVDAHSGIILKVKSK